MTTEIINAAIIIARNAHYQRLLNCRPRGMA